jgi:hypothetical protein
MITVRTILPFKRRDELIRPGNILQIPDDMLSKMKGLVEVVPSMTTEQAAEQIDAVAEELNSLGIWSPEIWKIITPKSKALIIDANNQVDNAADVLKDPEALKAALITYQFAWLTAIEEVRL